MHRKIIVAGSHGLSGSAAAAHFASQPDTKVYGLSRRTEPAIQGVESISVDLTNPAEVRRALADVRDITHIIFGAYIEKTTAAEKSVVNVALMRNLLDVVEKTSPGLQHITFYQGGKAYGPTSGRSRLPHARMIRG